MSKKWKGPLSTPRVYVKSVGCTGVPVERPDRVTLWEGINQKSKKDEIRGKSLSLYKRKQKHIRHG